MPRTVIVTGASGFIGTHLLERVLSTTDWRVIAISRRRVPERHRIEWRQADLNDSMVPGLPRADAIISLAAEVDVLTSLRVPEETMRKNTAIAFSVARYAAQHRIPVVHVSTGEVFGPGRHGLAAPTRPTNPYAASKAAQDAIFAASGASFVTARTANVFGEHQPSNRFVPTVIRSLVEGKPVKLIGNATRRWIHADDVAEGLIRMVDRPVCANLTGSLLTPNRVMVEAIASRLGVVPEFEEVPVERPGQEDLYDLEPVNRPAHDDLHAGLDRAVEWWAK